MPGNVAKMFGWLAGGVLGLGLVAYCVLFVANLNDQPRSSVIETLESTWRPTTTLSADDNSYLFVLGFSGPPETDPALLGLERYEWMLRARPEFRSEDDPLGDDYDFRTLRREAVAELAETCSKPGTDCLRLLESGEQIVNEWLTEEAWLLDRYRTLISMTAFREAVPFEVLAPLPSYGVLFDGQQLLIADTSRSANAGDARAVSATLDLDLAYWRMVLENSNVLITKMIATAAIVRHFKLGNLVLRGLPQEVASAGIPSSWRAEISDDERSMRRSLAGEWKFFDEMAKQMAADSGNPLGNWVGLTDSTTWDRAAWVILRPFWQPQDLSNRHAGLMLELGNAFDVPYREIPSAVELTDALQASTYRPFRRLYNLTGDIVMSPNVWRLSDYAVRVTDLEGVRRAALLAAELRAAETSKDDVVQRMLVSEIVDPYTNEPFTWRDGSGAIVFYGLEPHERGQHELIY